MGFCINAGLTTERCGYYNAQPIHIIDVSYHNMVDTTDMNAHTIPMNTVTTDYYASSIHHIY